MSGVWVVMFFLYRKPFKGNEISLPLLGERSRERSELRVRGYVLCAEKLQFYYDFPSPASRASPRGEAKFYSHNFFKIINPRFYGRAYITLVTANGQANARWFVVVVAGIGLNAMLS